MQNIKKSDKLIAKGLEAAMGNVSLAAKQLGYSRSGLHLRISQSEFLRQVMKDLRESMTDNAESSLNRGILAGEAWAVCFYLKCQGRDRGYVERTEIQQDTKVTMVTPLESMSDDELNSIIREEQVRRSSGDTVAEAQGPA